MGSSSACYEGMDESIMQEISCHMYDSKEETQIKVGSGCHERAERAGAPKLIYKERNRAPEEGQEQDTAFER